MTTLSGNFGAVYESTANTLADTPEFRVWIDPDYDPDAERTPEEETAAHDAAYARVYISWREVADLERPYALIDLTAGTRQSKVSAQGFSIWLNGSVRIFFEALYEGDTTLEMYEANKSFMDTIFGIIGGMTETIEGDTTGVYVQPEFFAPTERPRQSDPITGELEKVIQWDWEMGLKS
jgi:hypothetical protein